jgi:hypothetical protein
MAALGLDFAVPQEAPVEEVAKVNPLVGEAVTRLLHDSDQIARPPPSDTVISLTQAFPGAVSGPAAESWPR